MERKAGGSPAIWTALGGLLLAPNGAGKTTLIKLLATLLFPTEGKILWNGEDIHALGAEYRGLLGYLPQDFGFYPSYTAVWGSHPAQSKNCTQWSKGEWQGKLSVLRPAFSLYCVFGSGVLVFAKMCGTKMVKAIPLFTDKRKIWAENECFRPRFLFVNRSTDALHFRLGKRSKNRAIFLE